MDPVAATTLALSVVTLAAVLFLAIRQRHQASIDRAESARVLEALLRSELAAQRTDSRSENSAARQELLEWLRTTLGQQSESTRESLNSNSTAVRALQDSLATTVKNSFDLQNQQLANLARLSEEKLEAVRTAVEGRLAAIQQDNNAKLEAMRATVEEKLQSTLERRLGESFKIVSENLDKVQAAMLNMQTLAEGVGDLKRVMTNVTRRGAWGEFQLATILEQFLSPQQYDTNVSTKGGSERVEFAVKLPGRDAENPTVWLPIDAKFPKEDYERLVAALEAGAAEEAETAARQLEIRIKANARDIREKYINPPATTDFAIMFLPTEGLYAEVLRRRELAESIQRDHRVVIAGPTTLVALLNSLQMGFRTLAIEKRSGEVWQILGAVKTEFSKFGAALESVKRKLHTASNEIDEVGTRTRVMERKLRSVETLPDSRAEELLGTESPGRLPPPPAE
ncbi:MAG: DNA recombination protein RmuC [Terrimicrobiaceae bacterium]